MNGGHSTMLDPPVKNPVPTIYNLYTDPRAEKPTAKKPRQTQPTRLNHRT
jgi:hypothetical protein